MPKNLAYKDLIDKYLNPVSLDCAPKNAYASFKFPVETERKLLFLCDCLNLKKSRFLREIFEVSINEAFDALPEKIKESFKP